MGDGPDRHDILAAVCISLTIIIALALLCVQYGRALESCHSDGTTRTPITGCNHG